MTRKAYCSKFSGGWTILKIVVTRKAYCSKFSGGWTIFKKYSVFSQSTLRRILGWKSVLFDANDQTGTCHPPHRPFLIYAHLRLSFSPVSRVFCKTTKASARTKTIPTRSETASIPPCRTTITTLRMKRILPSHGGWKSNGGGPRSESAGGGGSVSESGRGSVSESGGGSSYVYFLVLPCACF